VPSHLELTYAGAWNWHDWDAWTDQPGATATGLVTVADGATVTVRGSRDPAHGVGTVSVDGREVATVDFYGEWREQDAALWTSPPLPAGPHTVTVTATGRARAGATGAHVDLTGLAVSRAAASAAGGAAWVPRFACDFDVPAAAGAEFAAVYGDVYLRYPDGSGDGKYRHANVSAEDGSLTIRVRSLDGVPTGAAGALFAWGLTGGRFAVRFRADPSAAGYGAAIQLWPSSDRWGDGEMDFPEGDFGGSVNLYHHRVGRDPEVNHLLREGLCGWGDWHTAVVEWLPGRSVRYLLDDRLVGEVTDPAQVPTTPHNWVVQAAAHGDAEPAVVEGRLQIDWAAVWSPG
jgi:hypothetical protein